eukprot:409885-Prymnesium_polylepis.1
MADPYPVGTWLVAYGAPHEASAQCTVDSAVPVWAPGILLRGCSSFDDDVCDVDGGRQLGLAASIHFLTTRLSDV